MSNQKVWMEVQSGYRLPCPSECEKEIHDRMMSCWKENSHERPSFRGLAMYFRNRSVAIGTMATYEIAPAALRGRMASMADENTSRAASLIADAVKEGKRNVKKSGKASKSSNLTSNKAKPVDSNKAGRNNSSSSISSSNGAKPIKKKSEISETEFGMGENYVDFMGKVCVGVYGCRGCV
jgi:hypothetical protein